MSYALPIDVYDYWAVLVVPSLFLCAILPITLIIALGVIASRTSLVVLYIGLPSMLAIFVALVFPLGRFFQRLDRARFDERQSAFLTTRAARWANTWLQYLSVNLAHVEGRPKRWYHYKVGKFS